MEIRIKEEKVLATQQLQELMDNLPEEVRYRTSVGVMEAIKTNVESLQRCPDKIDYLKNLYQQAEKEVNRVKKIHTPSCKKGCSFCCKIEVKCTETEVEYIMDHIADEPFTDEELAMLERQSVVPSNEYVFSKDRDCVFLTEDGECSVYEVRPLACRTYMVKSEPDKCNAILHNQGQVLVIASITTEMMRSTLYSALPSARLSTLLLKIQKERYGDK